MSLISKYLSHISKYLFGITQFIYLNTQFTYLITHLSNYPIHLSKYLIHISKYLVHLSKYPVHLSKYLRNIYIILKSFLFSETFLLSHLSCTFFRTTHVIFVSFFHVALFSETIFLYLTIILLHN
jgi:hypothetical protein